MPKHLTVWITTNCGKKTFYETKNKEFRGEKKRSLSFFPPWQFLNPISPSRAPDTSLLLRDPRLLISLRRNWLSHPHIQFSSIQSLSWVWLFATPWTTACRPPCPSPTSRVYWNSCPLSQWCHPTISFSVIPFSSCLQSFPVSGFFPVSQFFTSGGQSIGVSASASVLPMNTQNWSPSGWTGWISLQSKGLSRVFSNNTVQKHQFFSAQLSL